MLFSITVSACGGGGGGTTGGNGGGSTGGNGGGSAITATATTTAQSLTVNTQMASFSPLTPSGGTPPYSYSYVGTLPTGLSFSTSTGAVSGTPTAPYPTKSLFFTVKDANNVTSSTTSFVLFSVGAAGPITALATTTAQYLKVSTLTVGTPMASFSPLTPSGGALPYTYSYTGTLPSGLSFDSSTGAVSGTPTAPYPTASLVFSVKDANNVVASTTSTVPFTVSSGTVASTSTFPFQNAAKTLWANGVARSMSISGTCSGTGGWIDTPATTAATFEGVAGYSATRTRYVVFASSSPAFCLPLVNTQVETRYYDQNYMLLGYSRVGGYYYVLQAPLVIPATVTVGNTGTMGTAYAFTNSTKSVLVQTVVMSYVIEADTSNSAIVNVITKRYDLGNALIYTEQDRYRITATGALSLVSGDAQSAGGVMYGVFN